MKKTRTYSQLLTLKRFADKRHDQLWDSKRFESAIKYTKIAGRILELMVKMPIENVLVSH